MMTLLRSTLLLLTLGLVAAVLPDSVYAYGGPGSVISGIGTLLAAIAALLAALFGFVWFPLKRLVRKFRDNEPENPTAATEQTGE